METKPCLFLLLPVLFARLESASQTQFDLLPTWVSADVSNYSTGTAWADINNDGWLDLVVANGNDMERQHVVVYYNNGSGGLPLVPDWLSADIDYHGHLSVADVNKDGFVDVAVSVYLGPARFSQKGRVKLYLNNQGVLEALPSWVSADSMYTFSCAFGDPNGDGFPDLAVSCGEAYYRKPEHNRVYYNRRGALDSLPGWMSAETGYSYDVSWVDFDKDGDLDLAFANQRGPNRIYTNLTDSLGSAATWESSDSSQYANSLFAADVNNDGNLDLAVSDNDQLGGTGKFKVYLNNGGTVNATPYWTSAFSGYGSGITSADINSDGFMDLITGGWWQPCRIYVNHSGSFSAAPEWTSNTASVVEAIVCGDYDNAGLDTVDVRFVGNGLQKLYYLPHAPLQRILRVTWNGDPDSLREYCYDLENGWLSFAGPAGVGTLIEVRILVSHSLDLAVSNWDPTVGNYVFRSTSTTKIRREETTVPGFFVLEQNFPNPFNPTTTIQFSIVDPQFTILKVFDLLGREIATLADRFLQPGQYTVTWDATGFPTGTYLCRLHTHSGSDKAGAHDVMTRRMMLIR